MGGSTISQMVDLGKGKLMSTPQGKGMKIVGDWMEQRKRGQQKYKDFSKDAIYEAPGMKEGMEGPNWGELIKRLAMMK